MIIQYSTDKKNIFTKLSGLRRLFMKEIVYKCFIILISQLMSVSLYSQKYCIGNTLIDAIGPARENHKIQKHCVSGDCRHIISHVDLHVLICYCMIILLLTILLFNFIPTIYIPAPPISDTLINILSWN